MPLVALGGPEWTPDEMHHLSGCPSCRAEWELLRATSRLGNHPAAEIDIPTITRALQQRLGRTSERERRRKAWGFAGLAAAAALAGVLWSGPADPPPSPSAPVVAGLQIPLPELEELQAAELDSVLRGMDQPAPDIDTLETTDSGAVEAPELETIYDFWEG
jgi:hypothetical protein